MKTEEKSVIDSLENFKLGVHKSQSGNTTRLVDHIVQLLFQGYKVIVKDHCEGGSNPSYNLMLFRRVINRLRNEHLNLFLEHRVIGSDTDEQFTIEILE